MTRVGGESQSAAPLRVDEEREREIARLIEPGLRANAWRPDFERFRHRRLWEENRHGRRLRILDRVVPGLRGKRVLDLGAGRGGLTVALGRSGCRVVALDLRQSNCHVTRLRGGRYGLDVPAVRARGEALPFRRGAFDLVVCRDVLEHCARPRRLLKEIRRVLRRRGVCFVTAVNRYAWVDPHYHLAGLTLMPVALAERYVAGRGRRKRSGHDRQRISDMHYYGHEEFVDLVRGIGFRVRDLGLENLRRYRFDRPANAVRWLGYLILKPFLPLEGHFEFLLSRQDAGASVAARR